MAMRILLLLPTTTYRGEAFLDAARHLDLAVTIGSEGPPSSLSPPGVEWLGLDFNDPERSAKTVVQYAGACPIDAVIGVDDHTVVLAAVLARALGLPHNPVAAVEAARDKFRMRDRLHAHHVPVPGFRKVSIAEDPGVLASHVPYPCVVKPLVLSASCGVIRADTEEAFVKAFSRVATLLENLGLAAQGGAGAELLVEDFLPGLEVTLEGLLSRGTLEVLALFDKPDPMDGPYFEETIYVTPSRLPPETQRAVAETVGRAAEALGLMEGPIHGEVRVNEQGVWILEVAARSIGGRCSRTLRFAAGMSLEELILRHALRLDIPVLKGRSTTGAAGVMMVPIPCRGRLEEVRGQSEARAVPGIEEVTITMAPGQEVVPLPEGTRYLGFIVARGESPEAVEAALREAHQRLEIRIHPDESARDRMPACF